MDKEMNPWPHCEVKIAQVVEDGKSYFNLFMKALVEFEDLGKTWYVIRQVKCSDISYFAFEIREFIADCYTVQKHYKYVDTKDSFGFSTIWEKK